MARSTKASNAVLRLKERSGKLPYSMVSTSDGLFYLVLANDTETPNVLCPPLEIDAFVQFVNNVQKQAPKKASQFDLAFEAKIRKAQINK